MKRTHIVITHILPSFVITDIYLDAFSSPSLTITATLHSTFRYSVRDQAAHTKLKTRQVGQATEEELAVRDFKAELEAREKEHFSKRKGKWMECEHV